MNILFDSLTDFVTLDGKKYPVYTSFKNWIQISHFASYGSSISGICKILSLCYRKNLPPKIDIARCGITQFYSGAFCEQGTGKIPPNNQTPGEPLFDFYYDADVIYSDFLSVYGIDLLKEDMHFYKFCALFKNLGENSAMVKIINIRAADISKIENKSLKREYIRLKKVFSLGGKLPPEKRQQNFNDIINSFF